MQHIPVLRDVSLKYLDPQSGESVIDCTLGLGGHATSFLERIGKKGKLIGIDADEMNLSNSVVRVREPALPKKNVELLHANFRDLPTLDLPPCDVLFADLGLSSPHIDDPARGFTFREDGPLDCRFDQSQGLPASHLLQNNSETELIKLFQEYAEVQKAHLLVRGIIDAREKSPLQSSSDLVSIVEETYGFKAKRVLPQIFQALRIAVNDEMEALKILLEHGPLLLKPNGRMGIISYHSLEDRMVKQRFRALTQATKDPITGADLAPASFTLLTKKALQPTLEEVESNPRSRSAKLRIIQKAS